MAFFDTVKNARKALKMSQEELAEALKISFSTVNRWENGKTEPNKLTKSVFFDFCRSKGLKIEEES